MNTLAPSILISSAFLQVMQTPIKSRMGSKFGKIWPGTRRASEKSHRFIMEELLWPLYIAPSFLNWFSFLQVTRKTIKAWMSLNFCLIPSRIMELAAFEHLKNQCCDHSSPFILAGNEDKYKSLDRFEIRQDLTRDCGVSCPWACW